ncbi:HAMP domain-containing sensor histidine kinase [Yoonia sp. GPGPB17]|uniref:sensor histidine kinase n=1 Tax=Yoonia sp. GPGPB17 TaxID=3026147 RepID=UPI0030BA43AC
MARGEMARRAPVTGRFDEFDRLSLGINQMLDRVDTLNSNIEAVSGGVAHDLKTPLANVAGRLELIRRDMQDSAAVAEHVEAAENYLSQVLRIFNAILRLGEVEAGGRRAAFVDVDLSQLVRDLGEAYTPVFEDADKALTVDIAPKVHLRGDPELLQQLLANLLENALEHSRDAAKVHLRLRRDDDISLHVQDDGPGIALPDQGRVFDRFFRADRSRTSPGNGLGLSLVKAIADLHDAQATVESDAKGAHFRIMFQRPD